jgi:hypothetical protein
LFDYREGRGREGPNEVLENFKGHLQTDGYALYEDYGRKSGVTLLHCMAHARRKFDEAKDNDQARAEYVLTQMQKLYAIERQARDNNLTPEQRYALRQERSLPVLTELKSWMLENYKSVLPKSTIGQALHYSPERFDKLIKSWSMDEGIRVQTFAKDRKNARGGRWKDIRIDRWGTVF